MESRDGTSQHRMMGAVGGWFVVPTRALSPGAQP